MAKTHDYGLGRDSKRNNKGNRNGGNRNNGGSYNNGYSYTQRNSNTYSNNRTNNNPPRITSPSQPATAPYNFIPLPDKPVLSPLGKSIASVAGNDAKEKYTCYEQYIAEQGLLNGYIDYTLEALTPIYIGEKGNFFAPDGRYTIPGSTMRGLVKNYLKIISCGTMRDDEDFTNKHLYFRDFAGKKSSLKDKYMDRMSTEITIMVDTDEIDPATKEPRKKEKKRLDANVEGGFLAKIGEKYVIYPAEKIVHRYKRKKDKDGNDIFRYRTKRNGEYEVDEYGDRIKYFQYINNDKPYVEWTEDGAMIHSGKMSTKGHYTEINKPDWSNPLEVPQAVIADYRADNSKAKAIPSLQLLENKNDDGRNAPIARGQKFSYLMPCFYVAKDGVIESFGPTKYYRIPYRKSIAEHIPQELRLADAVDFADAIFGRKEDWASRVFFEDAHAAKSQVLQEASANNLMGPNPTSFQLYLQQENGKAVKHWDDNTKIRGYKLYWHNKIDDKGWHFKAKNNKERIMNDPIAPLGTGSTFSGRIRFNRLSAEELGALLAVFALCDDKHCFKIGMGKPIGMGSVKLAECRLQLIDTEKRYGSLFAEKGWQEGIVEKQSSEYVSIFEAYMQKQINQEGIGSDYQNITDALRCMLDWSNTGLTDKWKKELEYMPIGDKSDTRYKDRVPLETPQKILQRLGKK